MRKGDRTTEEGKEIISVMQEMFGTLNHKIDVIGKDVATLKQDVSELNQRVTKIETTLENVTNRNIQLLVQGHMQNAEKLDQLTSIIEDTEYMQLKTNVIASVTKLHTFEINRLRKPDKRKTPITLKGRAKLWLFDIIFPKEYLGKGTHISLCPKSLH